MNDKKHKGKNTSSYGPVIVYFLVGDYTLDVQVSVGLSFILTIILRAARAHFCKMFSNC